MTFEVVSDAERAYNFVTEFFPLGRTAWQKGICQLRDGEVVSAVVYDDCNRRNCFMHVAARPGKNWLTRHYLHEAFKFPFRTLGLDRVTGWVEASNLPARKFNEHLGFRHEATLQRAANDGSDILLYRMFKWECPYVRLVPPG